MGGAIMACLERFMEFRGRARRSEFWWFFLFTVLVGIATVPLELALQTKMISTGVSVAFLMPTLSAASRRLHDTGRSALYLLAPLLCLPFYFLGQAAMAGAFLFCLAMLVLILCLPGQIGANRYGPDPLSAPDLAAFE
ncbi:DUF805 domain-containing protein [Halovulum dunhuangense]|uniref:DUF805 domain-containing protein n=1 Tax=Halovulum dunhuangense TaxID=1505036 RepID=A0A849KY45_9RHOB|nr:DUF805 domain-containing protein [Halovulum dunhuangense]NNU79677.1 DUF805 domain-containing protein [Halovulum dunhuangense]